MRGLMFPAKTWVFKRRFMILGTPWLVIVMSHRKNSALKEKQLFIVPGVTKQRP